MKLKWLLFILISSFTFNFGFAQPIPKRNVTIGVGMWNKLRFKYEHSVTDKISLGTTFAIYYSSFPGWKNEYFARYYFYDWVPKVKYFYLRHGKFYGQAKFNFGRYSRDFRFFNEKNSDNFFLKQHFWSKGPGFNVGHVTYWGRKSRFLMDVQIGVKFVGFPTEFNTLYNGKWYSADVDKPSKTWYVSGPGAYFDAMLAFGYAF